MWLVTQCHCRMVLAEELPLSGRYSAPSMSKRRMLFAGVSLVLAVALVAAAAVVVSSPAQETSLESDSMLEPYFAWQAEKDAEKQSNHEALSNNNYHNNNNNNNNGDDDSELSLDPIESNDYSTLSFSSSSNGMKLATADDTESLLDSSTSIPSISPSHSSVSEEMAVEFKDRDLLAAVRAKLRAHRVPRAKLAAKETTDEARIKVLEEKIKKLAKRKQIALERLNAAERIADPLLQKASKVYNRAHSIQMEYEGALTQAKDEIATGTADLQKSIEMKKDFFDAELPVENAQVAADNADRKYRADALRFASNMLRTEKIGKKDSKLRFQAETKLNKLRFQLHNDQLARARAMKALEATQSDMHIRAGLQDYNRWKLRGEQLINKGKTLLKQSKSVKDEWDQWKVPLDKAQKSAADAETRVHKMRVAEEKISKKLAGAQSSRQSTQSDARHLAKSLSSIEKNDVALREEGAELMKNYHELKRDVTMREKERAKRTAEMATKNAETLKQLLDQE